MYAFLPSVILKYKGGGDVRPRKGDSILRLGPVNWALGKRFASVSSIDYGTNVDEVELDFSCSAS